MTPLEFLDGIINSKSPLIDPKLKVTAAGIAARYMHKTAGEADPARDARLIEASAAGALEGRLTTWTEADEQRRRYLSGHSYTPGLSAAERAELDALSRQKLHSDPLNIPWALEDSARLGWLQTERQHGRVPPGSPLDEELTLLEQRAAWDEERKSIGF